MDSFALEVDISITTCSHVVSGKAGAREAFSPGFRNTRGRGISTWSLKEDGKKPSHHFLRRTATQLHLRATREESPESADCFNSYHT